MRSRGISLMLVLAGVNPCHWNWRLRMRSIHEVLREREMQAEKLKDEIEKLREVVRILEGADSKPAVPVPVAPTSVPTSRWP
jgi:hypothetical protein